MKTPDQPGEGWALPDPGLAPSHPDPPRSAETPPPPPENTHPGPFEPPEPSPPEGPWQAAPPPPAHFSPARFQRARFQPARFPLPAERRPWIARPLPGTAYHRLARTSVHRWWRPLVGTLFAVAIGLFALLGVMAGAMAVAVILGEDPLANMGNDRIFSNVTADIGVQLLSLAVLTPVVLLAAMVVQRRPVGSLSSVTGRIRIRWLFACAELAFLACLASYVASWAVFTVTGSEESASAGWIGWGSFLPSALMIVVLVPFQAAAEEYVFRGWLLQAIASCTMETQTGRIGRAASTVLRTPWPAIVISALVFTACHAHRSWALFDVFLFGLMAGWLAVRTGGLEAPIALHVLNNLVAFMLPAATGGLGDAVQITHAPWQSVVGTIVQLIVFALLVLASFRRRGLDAVTPAFAADRPHHPGPGRRPGLGTRPQAWTTG